MSALVLLSLARQHWRLGLGVLALVAALGFVAYERHQGVLVERDRWEKRAAAAEQKAADLSVALTRKAQTAGEQAAASQVQIRTRTQTIIQKVPYEVPASANPALGYGWLRLYNASLGMPEDAGVAREPANHPATDAASALQTVAGNNGVCLGYRDQLEKLIAFYDQTRGEVNGFKP